MPYRPSFSRRKSADRRRAFLLVMACALIPLDLAAEALGQVPNRPAESVLDQAPVTEKPAAQAPVSASDLAHQVNNPAAPVTYIQFRNILVPDIAGTNGVTNSLQVQPVVPIGPFDSVPLVQLMKITMPVYVTVPVSVSSLAQPSGDTGIGDLQLFDLLTFKQSWGRWGFGPAFVFPTASADALGAGKWQLGPSVVAMFTGIKNLTAGAVLQNPISFAGSSSRPNVNNMIITPTLTYTLSKGWFAGLSDYNLTFDWENGGAATIPLGVQVGQVITIGRQPVSLAIEAGGTVARPADTPNPGWILGFEVSPIFSFHIGSGTKVKVRKPEEAEARRQQP